MGNGAAGCNRTGRPDLGRTRGEGDAGAKPKCREQGLERTTDPDCHRDPVCLSADFTGLAWLLEKQGRRNNIKKSPVAAAAGIP